MADQMVSHVAEVIGGDDRVGKRLESIGVHLLDSLDKVVEPEWIRHTSTLG
jgi:hypothetical protein